jgi:hypothetical protein
MLYDQLNALENRLRPLLGLGPKPLDGSLYFSEPDEHGNSEMLFPAEEVLDAEKERWHRESRRGRALSAAVDALKRVEPSEIANRLKSPLERRLLERELSSARRLEWRSRHFCTIGDTDHVDGYLVLPSGRHYDLDVSTAAYYESWVREGWLRGGVYREGPGTNHSPGVATAVVPVETLTPAVVLEAIERWYLDRFEYVQGHWSLLERRLPEFEVEDSFWSRPDDPRERELAEQAAERAERDLKRIKPQSETEERMARRYGRRHKDSGAGEAADEQATLN